MMIEQFGYPFIEGSGGIPFYKLRIGRIGQKIIGGSGSLLLCDVIEDRIRIMDSRQSDPTYRRFCLFADVGMTGGLNLHVRSRVDTPDGSVRHDDLFASKFVSFVLNYFDSLNVEIAEFRGHWDRGSDNFKGFWETLKRTGDKVEAAKVTWSGKTMIEHGFLMTDEEHIRVDEENDEWVEAIFKRVSRA